VARKLGDYLARLQAPAVDQEPLGEAGGGLEQLEVARDRRLDPGPQHLHRDLGAVVQGGEMDLGDGGACNWGFFKTREQNVERLAQ